VAVSRQKRPGLRIANSVASIVINQVISPLPTACSVRTSIVRRLLAVDDRIIIHILTIVPAQSYTGPVVAEW
jgi:hypothetical protein